MMKFSKNLVMLLTASVLAVTPAAQTFAAPVQIEERAKKEAAISQSELELKVGETAKLKVTGTKKKVKWSSSNTEVATVDKKGNVSALADGLCVITAKVGKKSYTCSVNVWSHEFTIDPLKFGNNGAMMWYDGELDLNAAYSVDGAAVSGVEFEDGQTNIFFEGTLSDGDHVLSISQIGYKTFSYTFNWTAPVFDGIFAEDPWVADGTLFVLMNPAVENAYPGFEVDGKPVTPKNSFVSGDGYFVAWIDATGLSKGTHKVTVSAEGFTTESREFTVE